jgi:hypothetical protein
MFAALIGHPGGYYATVSGGEPGNRYNAEVLVSPPNILRSLDIGNIGGLMALLWDNFWNMGESDPDVFTNLDFDNIPLDFNLLTSELPSYNYRSDYVFPATRNILHVNNRYALQTLGYLQIKAAKASDNALNVIRPTIVNGVPSYEFVNYGNYENILPQTTLYRPIILSEERYDELEIPLGHLVVKTESIEFLDVDGVNYTEGVNAYDLNIFEQLSPYQAKLPLDGIEFSYPIQSVSVDIVKDHTSKGHTYIARDVLINETSYNSEFGNLYFTNSIEDLIGIKAYLPSITVDDDTSIYYNVHIYFDRFLPDTDDERSRIALAQSTQYAVMDYFNQYTYAEVSANMISEIAYTETLTFWSTLISAPLIYFGSLGVANTVGKHANEEGARRIGEMVTRIKGQFVSNVLKAPIMEIFDEIIKDSFLESIGEVAASYAGWSEDAGFLLGTLLTSARELGGALGKIVLGGDKNMKNKKQVMLKPL